MGSTGSELSTYMPVHRALRPDYWEAVTREAMRALAGSPPELGKKLLRWLPKGVRVPGYRSVLKAPAELSAPVVAVAARSSVWLTCFLLTLWRAARQDLEREVAGYLLSDPLPALESLESQDNVPVWPVDAVVEHAQRFLASRSGDYTHDDVCLMMCMVAWVAPIPHGGAAPNRDSLTAGQVQDLAETADNAAEGGDMAGRWQAWLDLLRSLPATSPDWSGVESFCQQVLEIAAAKRRETAELATLSEGLALLQAQAEDLSYFQLTDVPGWVAESVGASTAPSVSEDVARLRECLSEHRALRGQVPASYAEESTLTSRKTAIGEEVVRLHASLARAFQTSEPPPGPGAPAPGGMSKPGLAEPTTDVPTGEGANVGDSTADLAPGTGPSSLLTPSPQEQEEVTQTPPATPLGPVPSPPAVEPSAPVSERSAEPAAEREAGTSADRPLATPVDSVPQAQTDQIPGEEALALAARREVGKGAEWQSARDLAVALQGQDDRSLWHDLLWALVAENDVAGAYWLAASLSAQGREPSIPPWLLKVLQGTRWLSPGNDLFQSDIFGLVKEHEFADDESLRGLATAAALGTVLIAPSAGLLGWLDDPVCCDAMYPIVSAVGEFARSVGMPLCAEDILGVDGENQLEAEIAAAAQDAQRWLFEAAPQKKVKYRNASSVWRYLVGQNGELHAMLLPVTADDRSRAERVATMLSIWRNPDERRERLRAVDQLMAGAKYRPTTGAALEQLSRYVDDACSRASGWLSLVQRSENARARGDWLHDRVTALQRELASATPSAARELLPHTQSASVQSRAVAASVADSLARVCALLHVTLDWDWHSPAPVLPSPSGADTLDVALAGRLMWLPEVSISADGRPDDEALRAVAPALAVAVAENRGVEAAIQQWLGRQDYRFVHALADFLPDDVADRVRQEMEEHHQGSIPALQEARDRALFEIEQAVVDGIIDEERRLHYAADVDGIDVARVQNFSEVFAHLEQIRTEIAERRQDRLDDLAHQWVSLKQQIPQDHRDQAGIISATALGDRAIETRDTRVLEELIGSLRSWLDGTSPAVLGHAADAPKRDILKSFVTLAGEIERCLEGSGSGSALAKAIEDGRTVAGLPFGQLAATRRREAAEALRTWQRLRQRRPFEKEVPSLVGALLSYLGFVLSVGDSLHEESRGQDWIWLRASMSASGLAKPIPQLGHQAQNRYDVVCFWDRPGVDTITARLSELHLSVQTVIAVYLGRLTPRQRRDVNRAFRQQHLSVAILDEVLLFFLAQEADARLGPFLRCSLPYSAVNPYTPFQAGDVPPEMFFGREDMARQIQDPYGSCILYGGRQLGKSALLRHVERAFHHPERGQYALLANLNLVYEPHEGGTPEQIWSYLRDQIATLQLFATRVRTERPDEIRKHIKTVLDNSGLRVLVLFDEADAFLDADARNGFPVVTGLRDLMLDTERRFKVVFAGLQSVQRFQSIPNQPLAHFGAPICVGPLEPLAARALVAEPLEALGYRFEDESVILRILIYTNYHPGLVQLFCHELLRELLDHTASELPPYVVRRRDVEAVYRLTSVREGIRQRFEWTLALDVRYEAIAWSLVVDQADRRDSYALPYAPAAVLGVARSWWPAAFEDVRLDEFGALLDEMVGLGVLARDTVGHYRLRSPNVVRLMGTEEDIGERLLQLTQQDPPRPPDTDAYHGPLMPESYAYSPLTYAQMRALNPMRSGVSLVHALPSGGAIRLVDAFRRLVPADDSGGVVFKSVPDNVTNGRKMTEWLEEQRRESHGNLQGVVYAMLTPRQSQAASDLLAEALRFLERRRPREQRLRVIFVFGAEATWTWLSADAERRVALEREVDGVACVRPWGRAAIGHALTLHDWIASDEVCGRALEVTGGWHLLVEELLSKCALCGEPLEAARSLESDLALPESLLRERLTRGWGLKGPPRAALAAIGLAAALGTNLLPLQYFTPDMLSLDKEPIGGVSCRILPHYLDRLGLGTLEADDLVLDPLVCRLPGKP